MTAKRCPHCKMWNLEIAQVCDCGFNFSTGTMPSVKTPDAPPVTTIWHIRLELLSGVLIPVFVIAAYLITKVEQLPPLFILLVGVSLAMPPVYWLLYFTCRKRLWARYLMLFIGLAGILAIVLITVSVLMRFIYPQ
jgi:hypothetical protein